METSDFSSSEVTPPPEWLIIFNSSNYIIRFQIALSCVSVFFSRIFRCVFFLLDGDLFLFSRQALEKNFFGMFIAIDPFHTWKLCAKFDLPSACQRTTEWIFFRVFSFFRVDSWWIMVESEDMIQMSLWLSLGWSRKKGNGCETQNEHNSRTHTQK